MKIIRQLLKVFFSALGKQYLGIGEVDFGLPCEWKDWSWWELKIPTQNQDHKTKNFKLAKKKKEEL
jgi:hypothetical protein